VTEIEPSCVGTCVGIGQKLTSVDQKLTTTMVTTFVTLWLGILQIFFIPDTWLCCRSFVKNFGQSVCQSHCQSNTLKYAYLDRLSGFLVERSHFDWFLMLQCDVNNHVSGGAWSGIWFWKAFDTDESLFNRRSKYGVGKLIECAIN